MKKAFFLLFTTLLLTSCDFSKYRLVREYDFTTRFEKSEGKETATYQETIEYYEQLDEAFASIQLQEIGTTDSGEPLHLALYNPEADFDLEEVRKEKTLILINNGIHPGESDGIDASMMLLRDLAQDSIKVPENVVLAVIPIYNVGGALTRNSTTRANQNGPASYGFRGNARNFDLNRDFIKSDSKNMLSFAEIFHFVKPDVFVDTHVSNGADYQYTITHLFTQHNKMGGEIGSYVHKKMMPELEQRLEEKGWPITPYVNVFNEVPEKGFSQFMDSPRYSTGYASLWNTLGLMIETHMLKPYNKRVAGTYEFLASLVDYVDDNSAEIQKVRSQAFTDFSKIEKYPIAYEIDSSKASSLNFKGYEPEIAKSQVTGGYRLKYNRNKPYTKKIDYYNYFKPTSKVDVPQAFIIPKAYDDIIRLLQSNRISMAEFEKDSVLPVEVYYIKNFETVKAPYEGHYLHYNTEVVKKTEKVKVRKGDLLVSTDQPGIKYLLETLEPEAVDSFFNWNFFDPILQQKEHYSAYVFEDLALQLLQENPKIKEAFEQKKKDNFSFSKNPEAQLEWIYKNSPHYELQHLRYPVFRIR